MKPNKFHLTFTLALALVLQLAAQTDNVGIGTTTPDPSAALDVQSIDKGVLIPRMTTAQREAIASPATGLKVYDTDEKNFFYWDGTRWFRLGIPADGKLNEFLKPDANGNATWQPLLDTALWPAPEPLLISNTVLTSTPIGLAVHGNYAYLTDYDLGTFNVIDISDPANPFVTGSLAGVNGAIAVQGNYAYVVKNSTIKVINVADPANPVLSGSLAAGSDLVAVAVQGNYAYVVDYNSEELKVIDVSNPASPSVSGSLNVGGPPISVAVEGSHVYVVGSDSQVFKVIDVSNPASPSLSGSLTIGYGAGTVVVQGSYAYVIGIFSLGLKVIDVSNPGSPSLSGSLVLGNEPISLAVQGNYACVVDQNSDDLKVIDISDPASPSLSSSFALGDYPNQVAMQGNFAYVTDGEIGEFRIIQLGVAPMGVGINGEPTPYYPNLGSGGSGITVSDSYTIDHTLSSGDLSSDVKINTDGDNILTSTSTGLKATEVDGSTTNELQTISKSGSTVTLSNGGGSFTDAVNDADASPTNELQTISKTGNTVTLSNGGGSFTDDVDDADASPTNELNTSFSLSGYNLSLTDAGGTQTVDLSALPGSGSGGHWSTSGTHIYNNNTGSVGIGIAPTDQKLELFDGNFKLKVGANENDQGILFQNLGSSYTWNIFRTDAGSNKADLVIAGGSPAANPALMPDRFHIASNGNIGINIAAPLAKFHVNGTSRFDGTINTNNQWISGDGGAEGISIDGTGSVGIGTNPPDQSAQLDIESTDKGMLVPRLTTAQRTAIASPATGLLVYDTDADAFHFYDGSAWQPILSGSGGGEATTVSDGNTVDLTLTGTDISAETILDPAGGNILTSSASGLKATEVDGSTTNELQTISKTGNTVTLSNSGGSFTDEVDDADADPLNETNTSLTLNGWDLELTDAGGTKTVNLTGLPGTGTGGHWANPGDDIYNNNVGNVGIGTSTPSEKLEINGAIKIDDTSNATPAAGTIRWNPATEDFEGYTGTQWKSLTSPETKFWGNPNIIYKSTETDKLTASDGATDDQFGWSVSLSGDYALIGAYGDSGNGNGSYSGSAYVFVRSGTAWTEQAKLTASDGASGDFFGNSVSLSGDYALIGAYQDDDNGNLSGSAYVFVRSGTTWTEQAKLTASDGAANDWFGNSVSLSGDYALIGATKDSGNGNGSYSGSAYVFVRSGTAWTEQAKLTASDGAANDWFGNSVSLSGDYALIGAYGDSGNGNGFSSGSAYVFVRSGTAWTEQAKLTASDGATDDQFGWSVSLSGDYALIGAYGDDNNVADSGSAYVFVRSGTTWTEQAKLTASDGAANDWFGWSVSLSGDYALIGAYRDDNNVADSGSAYFFVRSGTTWTEQAKLTASDGATDDQFGWSVSLSGDYALIGASYDDDNGDNSGSVYVFE
ncbi:MAG: hypothetical protein H6577_00820 [Lewinellaceae bacterium]|nr:hypothetical protein [Lewinellaceae bacterium]